MKILYFILNSRFKWTTIQHFALSVVWGLFKLGNMVCRPLQWLTTLSDKSKSVPIAGEGSGARGLDWEFLASRVTHLLLWWAILPRLWWSPEWSAECGWESWQSCGPAGGHSPHTFGWLPDTRLRAGSTVGAAGPYRVKEKEVLSPADLAAGQHTSELLVGRCGTGWSKT